MTPMKVQTPKWLSENEIPDLNSLKRYEFERKTNIGDIYLALMRRKVSKTDKQQQVVRVQCKSSRWQMFFKIVVRPATLLKRDSNTDVFLWNLRNL